MTNAEALPLSPTTPILSHLLSPLYALLLVLALRMIHLMAALRSPLTFQVGPDEDFYRRFGMDVAFGSGGMTAEFAFMDPLYGYLLGALFTLGASALPVYLLQVLVDVGTAYALILIARHLGRPRLGLLAALIYALLGPAIAFTVMLLKTTLVTAFITWWMLMALRTFESHRLRAWLSFGLFCGLGVALRSNLILLAALTMLLLPVLQWRIASKSMMLRRAGVFALAMALPLALLTGRNVVLADRWTPLPTNGGVVLHQLYNPENPLSLSGAPSFVRYGHPSEIHRGYVLEAQRRTGRSLDAKQVDDYWRAQGKAYLLSHPWQSFSNGVRKLGEFAAYPEVPNNRSYSDERRFSPILAVLPQPFGWLFALGVPGLILLVRSDRRGWLVLAPVAMGLFTIAVFFAEDRFRFNIVSPFVLGSAWWLGWLAAQVRGRRWLPLATGLLFSILLGTLSLWRAQSIKPTPMDWQRIANGYIRMGERSEARRVLEQVQRTMPDAVGLHDIRGLMALQDKDYVLARHAFEQALAQRQDRHEVWHNYSMALEQTGELEPALGAEARARALSPLGEYTFRMATLLQALGREAEAVDLYRALELGEGGRDDGASWAGPASERLRELASHERG